MTETDWITCTSRPADMLQHVRGTTPVRKLQLLGSAGCRLIWDLIPDQRAREAIESLEQFADGEIAAEDHAKTWMRFHNADLFAPNRPDDDPVWAPYAHYAVYTADSVNPGFGLGFIPEAVAQATSPGRKRAAAESTRRQICDLIREIIGNPFRPWMAVPDFLGGGVVQPDGKTVRLTDTARRLAEGIRADQAFDRLPILADALEEAGVTDGEMLAHCRRDGGHVRGCWALDVVLGKA